MFNRTYALQQISLWILLILIAAITVTACKDETTEDPDPTCTPGTKGCECATGNECFPVDEDNNPLTCSEDNMCVLAGSCTAGETGCECVSGECLSADDECSNNICIAKEQCVGDLNCACDDGACNNNLECRDDTCQPRENCDGELGCACDDGSCNDGLICTEDVCIEDCAGQLDCACDNGSCNGDLVCTDNVCTQDCAGELNCACNDGSCNDGLECIDDTCSPRQTCDGELGCACNNGACNDDLECIDDVCRSAGALLVTISGGDARACDLRITTGDRRVKESTFPAGILGKSASRNEINALALIRTEDSALSGVVAVLEFEGDDPVNSDLVTNIETTCYDRLGNAVDDVSANVE